MLHNNIILETRAVCKTYGTGAAQVMALQSASVTLAQDEVLLIMGPSGSGKTTLLSVMVHLAAHCRGGTGEGAQRGRLR